jgi:hypothetical protein
VNQAHTQILHAKFVIDVRHASRVIMQMLRAPAAQEGMLLLGHSVRLGFQNPLKSVKFDNFIENERFNIV